MQPSRLIRSLSFVTSLLLVIGLAFMTTPASSAPKKPGKFRITKISATTDSATVAWTGSRGASGYKVCLFDSTTAKSCSIVSATTSSRSITINNLTPNSGNGKDWVTRVHAHNTAGWTPTAKIGFDLKVGTVGNPHATSSGPHHLTYGWNRPTNGDFHQLQITTDRTFKTGTSTKGSWNTSYSYTGLKPHTTYYMRMRGKNGATTGPWSTPLTATTPANSTPTPTPTFSGAPPAPQKTGGHGDFLTFGWSPVPGVEGYETQISPDPSFATRTSDPRFTTQPRVHLEGLNGGTVYHTRIRTVTRDKRSAWGPATSEKLSQPDVNVSVATYNLCGEDKCRPGASATFLKNVPAWSQRKATAGALIRSGNPDVIVAQESKNSTTKFQTELPGYTVGSYHRGKSIFFRSSRFTSADRGGITLDATTKKFAAWEKLRDTKTGSTFYVINVHLTSGKNATRDKQRELELTRLHAAMDTINVYEIPVVWAGDWNSNADNANQKKYPGGYDAPRKFFADRGIKDAIDVTPIKAQINGQLNSANYGSVTPKASSHRIDAIYVENKTRVTSWRMLTHFSDGTDRYVNGKTYKSPFGSDHNPILASLVLGTS